MKKLNLILLGVDSLWADHMSGYGYSRLTTPHIDRFAAQGHPAGVGEADRHGVGVGPRRQLEVVAEPSLVAAEDHIDARVDVLVTHLAVVGDARVPPGRVVADEVIGFAGKFFQTSNGSGCVSPMKRHLQRGAGGGWCVLPLSLARECGPPSVVRPRR